MDASVADSSSSKDKARRWWINLLLLLAITIPYSVWSSWYISSTFAEDPFWLLFLYGLPVTTGMALPGMLLYLWVLDARARRRPGPPSRLFAVFLSPLVTIVPMISAVFVTPGALYALGLLPWALLYGNLVRLPVAKSTPGSRPSAS